MRAAPTEPPKPPERQPPKMTVGEAIDQETMKRQRFFEGDDWSNLYVESVIVLTENGVPMIRVCPRGPSDHQFRKRRMLKNWEIDSKIYWVGH